MRRVFVSLFALLACAAGLSSKDTKVTFHQMALGMQDAFNCGVIVEEYLHGALKGKKDEYDKQRTQNNCAYVESVLNSLQDQGAGKRGR